jgi:hypothetical protein
MVFSKTLTHVERNDGIPPDIIASGEALEKKTAPCGPERSRFSFH